MNTLDSLSSYSSLDYLNVHKDTKNDNIIHTSELYGGNKK